jgi:SAM-dependent methyltransferase
MADGDFVTQNHLGGYVEGGDPASWYPDMWEWAIEVLHVGTMIDVGCGDGAALRWFRDKGAVVIGIDGVEQNDIAIFKHDYSTGPFSFLGGGLPPPTLPDLDGVPDIDFWDDVQWDLAWSCEFVEHVDERYVPNFLETFKSARWLMMTHALPGQPGWHHVNCRDDAYWKDMLDVAGFDFDEMLTEHARSHAEMNTHPDNYFAKTGLVFGRRT